MATIYPLIFCQSVIALVFAISAIGKATNMVAFQEAIINFKLLPAAWSQLAAWLFLIGELAVVVFMISGFELLPFGFLLATLLLIVFSTALMIALRRKHKISCNCFGQTERQISISDIVRNAALALCSLFGLFLLATTNDSLVGVSFVNKICVSLVGAIFVTFVTNLGEIITLYQKPAIMRE